MSLAPNSLKVPVVKISIAKLKKANEIQNVDLKDPLEIDPEIVSEKVELGEIEFDFVPDIKISDEGSARKTPPASPGRMNRFQKPKESKSAERNKTAPQHSTSKKPRKRWDQTQQLNLNLNDI